MIRLCRTSCAYGTCKVQLFVWLQTVAENDEIVRVSEKYKRRVFKLIKLEPLFITIIDVIRALYDRRFT